MGSNPTLAGDFSNLHKNYKIHDETLLASSKYEKVTFSRK